MRLNMGTHSSGIAVQQTNKQAIYFRYCFKNGSFLGVLGKRKEPKGQQKGTAY